MKRAAFLFSVFVLCYCVSMPAQTKYYEVFICNKTQVSVNEVAFDIYIISTSYNRSPFNLYQIKINLNTNIERSSPGLLAFTYVNGSSELPEQYLPLTTKVQANRQGESYKYMLLIPGRIVPGASLPIGAGGIGVKIGRFSIKTTDNSILVLPELTWNFVPGTGYFASAVYTIAGGHEIDVTNPRYFFDTEFPDNQGIKLISPNGGEKWLSGAVRNLRWNCGMMQSFKIEFSPDAGISWQTIAERVLGAGGIFQWQVPQLSSNTCIVRMTAGADSTVHVQSDSVFAVNPILSQNTCMTAGWNLVSVPLDCEDMSAASIFPRAVLPVFQYNDGYSSADLLESGSAYWVRCSIPDTVVFNGIAPVVSEKELKPGWNLVGPFSEPVNVQNIRTVPQGIICSNFFEYSSGYRTASVLRPGLGYWVKTNAPGKLYFY